MCFDQTSSGVFAALGLGLSWYVYAYIKNTRMAMGIFFFFLMEFLQFVQHFWIDQCDTTINQVLTLAGFLHICLQPFFTHVINSSLTCSEKTKAQFKVILNLCLLGGLCLFGRWFFTFFTDPAANGTAAITSGACPSTEWMRGDKLCTYKGNYHLAWSVPMVDGTYNPWTPGVAIHSFMMFAPFFVFPKPLMWIQGAFLFLTGPALGAWFTSNLHEQASIWCFFSIGQIAMMVFLVRSSMQARKDKAKEHTK